MAIPLRWHWNECRRKGPCRNNRIQRRRRNRRARSCPFPKLESDVDGNVDHAAPEGMVLRLLIRCGDSCACPDHSIPGGYGRVPEGRCGGRFSCISTIQSLPTNDQPKLRPNHRFRIPPLSQQPRETSVASLTHRCSRLFKKSLIRS